MATVILKARQWWLRIQIHRLRKCLALERLRLEGQLMAGQPGVIALEGQRNGAR